MSKRIVSLNFSSPDNGANGFNEFNFTRLANSGAEFVNLQKFSVQQSEAGEHNMRIISTDRDYGERGVIAKLADKMPNLCYMSLPSAPDRSFFDTRRNLEYLSVQMGYDKQNFILNLATSLNLPNLKWLDIAQSFWIDDESDRIGFDELYALFGSQAFSGVGHFTLRGADLDKRQLKALLDIKKVQFLYVAQSGGKYVNNIKFKDVN